VTRHRLAKEVLVNKEPDLVEFNFYLMNDLSVPVSFFWLNKDQEFQYGTIEPHTLQYQASYLGHHWRLVAEIADTNETRSSDFTLGKEKFIKNESTVNISDILTV